MTAPVIYEASIKRPRRTAAEMEGVKFAIKAICGEYNTMTLRRYGLMTRPTKQTDSRAKSFDGESIEVDALDPKVLEGLVSSAISQHIPLDVMHRHFDIEAAERETMENLAFKFEFGEDCV